MTQDPWYDETETEAQAQARAEAIKAEPVDLQTIEIDEDELD